MHPVARRRTRSPATAPARPPPRPPHLLLRPLHPRLRSFPSAAPLRLLLRSLFSYSEGWRGVVDGKRRSRRGSALLRSAGTLGGAARSADEAGSSGCAGWLAAHRACPVESLAGWSSGSVLAGAPELRHRPRARRGARRAPSDSDSGALGGSFRPAPRHIGVATAESCGNRRAHPGCWPERSSQSAISRPGRAPREPSSPPRRAARTLWRLRPRRCCAPAPGAPGRRPPPPQSGASTGREDRAGKGGRRITFGCVGGAVHPGNGVIAPLRDGRGAGRRVKDTRWPPF